MSFLLTALGAKGAGHRSHVALSLHLLALGPKGAGHRSHDALGLHLLALGAKGAGRRSHDAHLDNSGGGGRKAMLIVSRLFDRLRGLAHLTTVVTAANQEVGNSLRTFHGKEWPPACPFELL